MRCAVLFAVFTAIVGAAEPKRPAAVIAVIDRARGVPAEFTADALLRLVESPIIADRAWKLELIEEAFEAAGRAQNPMQREGALHTDTRYGWVQVGQRGLDSMSLRARALGLLLPIDPPRARALFADIHLPEWKPLTCKDTLMPNYGVYYSTLQSIFNSTFSDEDRKKERDVQFVESRVLAIRSALEFGPALRMVLGLKTTRERREGLLNSLTSVAAGLPLDPRSVMRADKSELLGPWIRDAGPIGLAFLSAHRSYLVRAFGEARCTRYMGRPDDPAVLPSDVAVYNQFISGFPDLRPIAIDEVKNFRDAGKIEDVEFWQSDRSKQVLEHLRWLSHGNRRLPDGQRFWTAEERKSLAWNERYLELLKTLEDWKPSEESSSREYFHTKAHTYMVLADLVPPGPAHANAVLNFYSYVAQSYSEIEDHVEWYSHAGDLFQRSKEDRAEHLAAMEASGNAVLALYAALERITRPAASRPKSSG